MISWAAATAAAGEHCVWICVLGGCCAVDALLLSNARDSDRAQQVAKNKIQIFLNFMFSGVAEAPRGISPLGADPVT